MKNVFQDVRVGSRLLLKRPALLVVSVLTLGLGIAATTLLASVVTAFVSGLAPAWDAWRTDLVASLKRKRAAW